MRTTSHELRLELHSLRLTWLILRAVPLQGYTQLHGENVAWPMWHGKLTMHRSWVLLFRLLCLYPKIKGSLLQIQQVLIEKRNMQMMIKVVPSLSSSVWSVLAKWSSDCPPLAGTLDLVQIYLPPPPPPPTPIGRILPPAPLWLREGVCALTSYYHTGPDFAALHFVARKHTTHHTIPHIIQ